MQKPAIVELLKNKIFKIWAHKIEIISWARGCYDYWAENQKGVNAVQNCEVIWRWFRIMKL